MRPDATRGVQLRILGLSGFLLFRRENAIAFRETSREKLVVTRVFWSGASLHGDASRRLHLDLRGFFLWGTLAGDSGQRSSMGPSAKLNLHSNCKDCSGAVLQIFSGLPRTRNIPVGMQWSAISSSLTFSTLTLSSRLLAFDFDATPELLAQCPA